MQMIGLTGGIGSGKSTVARALAQRGWCVVDADGVAREVVEPGQPALGELAQAFGPDILRADGSLDRAKLARRAFVDEEHTQLLNSITHPRIKAETNRLFAEARAAGVEYCVYDMPLLVDLGLHRDMDCVIVVDVAVEERVRRLVDSRGLDEADARWRIAAQIPDAQRNAAATYLIDNNGTPAQLADAVDKVAARIEEAAAGG